MHGDSKRIARQWNREIDDELRRAERRRAGSVWKAVVWGVLWLVWLVLLVATIARVAILR